MRERLDLHLVLSCGLVNVASRGSAAISELSDLFVFASDAEPDLCGQLNVFGGGLAVAPELCKIMFSEMMLNEVLYFDVCALDLREELEAIQALGSEEKCEGCHCGNTDSEEAMQVSGLPSRANTIFDFEREASEEKSQH
jgi:hypothetical protein